MNEQCTPTPALMRAILAASDIVGAGSLTPLGVVTPRLRFTATLNDAAALDLSLAGQKSSTNWGTEPNADLLPSEGDWYLWWKRAMVELPAPTTTGETAAAIGSWIQTLYLYANRPNVKPYYLTFNGAFYFSAVSTTRSAVATDISGVTTQIASPVTPLLPTVTDMRNDTFRLVNAENGYASVDIALHIEGAGIPKTYAGELVQEMRGDAGLLRVLARKLRMGNGELKRLIAQQDG